MKLFNKALGQQIGEIEIGRGHDKKKIVEEFLNSQKTDEKRI